MKMCINWKVFGGLGLAGLGVLVLAPNLIAAAVPLLVLAACPLSMLVMMRAMSGSRASKTGTSSAAGQSGSSEHDNGEVARLRAQIEHLRAERSDDDGVAAGPTTHGS